MGTRSLTIFKGSTNQFSDTGEIAVLYRQYDGYPSGHGLDLAGILAGGIMVNGIPVGKDAPAKMFNGMNCLTAQVIANLKDGVGNVYLYPVGTRDMWEEYIYEVTGIEGHEPRIRVFEDVGRMDDGKWSSEWHEIFSGTASEALEAFPALEDWE